MNYNHLFSISKYRRFLSIVCIVPPHYRTFLFKTFPSVYAYITHYSVVQFTLEHNNNDLILINQNFGLCNNYPISYDEMVYCSNLPAVSSGTSGYYFCLGTLQKKYNIDMNVVDKLLSQFWQSRYYDYNYYTHSIVNQKLVLPIEHKHCQLKDFIFDEDMIYSKI